MNTYEHKCYLSDGTVLNQKQCDELNEKGELVLGDGRTLKADAKFRGEYLWAQAAMKDMKEKGIIS